MDEANRQRKLRPYKIGADLVTLARGGDEGLLLFWRDLMKVSARCFLLVAVIFGFKEAMFCCAWWKKGWTNTPLHRRLVHLPLHRRLAPISFQDGCLRRTTAFRMSACFFYINRTSEL
jgi:hypothetical protein